MEETKILTCDWCMEKDIANNLIKVEDRAGGVYLNMHEECEEAAIEKYN